MNDFCVETLTHDAALRAQHGVLRSVAFAVTSDAHTLAEQIARAARADADAILESARIEAEQAVRAREEETLRCGQQLLQSLEKLHADFLGRAEDMVLDLAQALFERLAAEMSPRERIAAMLRHLVREAPPRLVTPLLRVHPDDLALLPTVEWEVKADAALIPGRCRLEAASGEWCVDFESAVEGLKRALGAKEPRD